MTNLPMNNEQQKELNTKSITNWMKEKIQEYCGLDKDSIDIDTTFDMLGVDSATAIMISGDLQEYLDIELDPTIFYDHLIKTCKLGEGSSSHRENRI